MTPTEKHNTMGGDIDKKIEELTKKIEELEKEIREMKKVMITSLIASGMLMAEKFEIKKEELTK